MLIRKNKAFSIFYFILGVILFMPSISYAKCSSPNAATGGKDFQYSSAGSLENFCDDSDIWKMIREVDDTGAGIRQSIQFADDPGACTAAKEGRLRYSAGSWDYCDSTTWQALVGGGLWTDGGGGDIYFNSGTPQVGIGLTNPTYSLDVSGSVHITDQLIIDGTAGVSTPPFANIGDLDDVVAPSPADGEVLKYVSATGNWVPGTGGGGGGIWTAGAGDDIYYNSGTPMVGIGKTDPTVELDVVGDIDYTGTLTDLSDRRLKENIVPLSNSLEGIMVLQGYSFTMKNDESGAIEYGLMAQDVEPVFPELVKTKASGTMTLNYMGLFAPLIEATKQQQAVIETLTAQNAELTAQNAEFEARLQVLESGIDSPREQDGEQ